jgi:hypothetical protein
LFRVRPCCFLRTRARTSSVPSFSGRFAQEMLLEIVREFVPASNYSWPRVSQGLRFARIGDFWAALQSVRDGTVAPRVGAWIETRHWRVSRFNRPRRSPRGSVDRNQIRYHTQPVCLSRSPRGSVDRNAHIAHVIIKRFGRSPRGSVDRNQRIKSCACRCKSRSPRGSVDRNSASARSISPVGLSLPAWERGSKQIPRGTAADYDYELRERPEFHLLGGARACSWRGNG